MAGIIVDGAESVTRIAVAPGAQVALPCSAAELAEARIGLVGNDLEIALADGRVLLLVGFAAAEGLAPAFALEGGATVAVDDLLAELGRSLAEIETAVGGPQAGSAAPNQQASFRPVAPLAPLAPLEDHGAVGATELGFGGPSVPQHLESAPLSAPGAPADPLLWAIEADGTVDEGTAVAYTVSYGGGPLADGQSVYVTVDAGGGSATEGADFSDFVPTVLTFTNAASSQTVAVQTTDDTVVEGSEGYTASITGVSSGTVVGATATTEITDNDQDALQWSIGPDGSLAEGGLATYTVAYTGATIGDGQSVYVTVDAGSGTATEGADFSDFAATVLTFTNAASSQTVAVQTADDTVVEGSEGYTASITGVSSGTVVDGTATTEITDNDQDALQWAIGPDGSLAEGGLATYTVAYSGATIGDGQSVYVTVDAVSGSATEGADFSDFVPTVLTFTNAASSQTIAVQTADDTVVEGSESYTASITGVSSGTVVDGTATTEITDNDQTALQWSIGPDGSLAEGGLATYTVAYTGATIGNGQSVYVTVDAGSGSATEGADFAEISPTVLTFTNAASSQTVAVQTTEDTVVEGSESYQVEIIGVSSGTVVDATATTEITDNDQDALQWGIGPDGPLAEGGIATYTVAYTGATIGDGQSVYVTVDAGSGTATEGADFSDFAATVLTFVGGGATAKTFAIQTVNDALVEGTESYSASIAGVSSGTVIDGTATTEITDNDQTALHWSIDPNRSLVEGGTATYTVAYSGATIDNGHSVYVTVNATGSTATEGSDFSEISPIILTFVGGGATAKTVAVQTTDDTVVEGNEIYSANITGVSSGVVTDATATTTITDNDQTALQWTIGSDGSVAEGGLVTYTVAYSGATIGDGRSVRVTVNASSGTATEGSDFANFPSTVLTFTNAATAKTFAVQTTDDTTAEVAETYTARITDVNSGTIVDGTATTTIIDNDQPSHTLSGVLATNSNAVDQPLVLTIVEVGDPTHAAAKLYSLNVQGQQDTAIAQDVGFGIDPGEQFRVALEMGAGATTEAQIHEFALEGVTIYDGNQKLEIDGRATGQGGNDPAGMTAIIDPAPSGSLVQAATLSTDNSSSSGSLTDSSSSTFNMLFGDAGNDTLTGSSGADLLSGGTGTDSLSGGGGDDILVYGAGDVRLNGGSGIDILRIDDGALKLFNNSGTIIDDDDTLGVVDLRGNTAIQNTEVVLLTEDVGADAHKGTRLVLNAADLLSFTDGTRSGHDVVGETLYVLGSAGDQVKVVDADLGNWVGNFAVQRTETDAMGQSFDVYRTDSGAELWVDTDITIVHGS